MDGMHRSARPAVSVTEGLFSLEGLISLALVAVNYIGLIDELALFSRVLTPEEIGLLRSQPAVLAGLKRK